MGAQSNTDLQLQRGRASNSEKCLICYGPHTKKEKEKGISFELKNLKEIFIKSFSIRFLPHFSNYGRVHMCIKCHEEFMKLERLYDDLEGNESKFDAVREQFAFVLVESVIRSQFINNYVHGNAFDAIRYLVFKEWGGKFRKQNQIDKAKMEKAKHTKSFNETAQRSGLVPANSTSGSNLKVEVRERSLKQPGDLVKSSSLNSTSDALQLSKSIGGSKTFGSGMDTMSLNRYSKLIPLGNDPLNHKSGSNLIETEIRNGGDSKTPVEKTYDSTAASSPKWMLDDTIIVTASSVSSAPESKDCRPPKDYSDGIDELHRTTMTNESIRNAEVDNESSTIEAAMSSKSLIGACNNAIASASNGPRNQTDPSETQTSIHSISLAPTTNSASVLPQSTYILSPDGRKLISKSGKLPPKHKLIFVKRDPATGKMVRVPKPNFSMVKGKFNGREVIVRSASSINFQSQSVQNSVGGLKHTKSSSSELPPQENSLYPVKDVVTEPGSPSVPRIVSVHSIPASSGEIAQSTTELVNDNSELGSNNQPETRPLINPCNQADGKSNRLSPDGKVESTDDISKSKLEPQEVRSVRSGRRIKRVYDSSSWASGLEMDQLVAQSLKDGRTDRSGYSPVKRHKDSRQPSISNESTDPYSEYDFQD